ncbi:apolipoprotein N-acyltransferase [Streptomyces sp. JJ66]|uniref:apolipoprotein N-acyltransferase n=1 Tax=Streptomyces sp. JJ66 TaxID=2803843 RepID=UPI001C57FE68|nr:apolipoprotein N-acyltransferase [Streptomyces sp. JJ66]MBW1603295.1 apolipoprotein N-acyltransferase [Streptomyces sp. JJ66]
MSGTPARWWHVPAAFLAGTLPALAFPAPALWWLAYVALVPWLLVLRAAPGGRRAAVCGWLGGTGFVLATHHWLTPHVHVFLLPLAALLGLLWAPWGWLAHRLLAGPSGGRHTLRAVVLLPSGWLVAELVRSWEYAGGPWGMLGASQWQWTPALRVAALGGVWLVGWLIVAVNVAVTVVLTRPLARGRLAAAGVLGCCALLGLGAWASAAPPPVSGAARIAVVQPGELNAAEPRFARGLELTRALAGREVDLVVWAESSVGFDLSARPERAAQLAGASRAVGAPLLVNVDARRVGGPGIFKSSVLVDAEGVTGDRYDKMRLVPFGEYVPLRSVLGWVTQVGQAARVDRVRGGEPVVMDADGLRAGPLICFETAFPDMSRQLVREGAQVLVGQSATSSFQETWAPEQHASLGALRAAETGRSMVHATLTGVTAVYGPGGEPVGPRLGPSRGAAEVYPVPLAAGETPYVRIGDWAVWLSLGTLALAGGVALGHRMARRGEVLTGVTPAEAPRR